MTRHGFELGIQKLIDVYGAKPFHLARTRIVAQKLAILTDADFDDVCEEIIANRNQPPTLEHFMEVSQKLRDLRNMEWKQKAEAELLLLPICPHCRNSGYENLTHETWEGRKYDFAYGCRDNCTATKLRVPPTYPRYSLTHFEQNAKRVFGKPRQQEEGA